MKEKSEVKINGKPVFYAVLFNDMKRAAIDLGYMLTIHGSMHTDMDLIAVAWVDEAQPAEMLVQAISKCVGQTVWSDHHIKSKGEKPHGRIAYTLNIMGDWFVDLSIIPPKPN